MIKSLKIGGLLAMLLMVTTAFSFKKADVKEVKIQTSAVCEMCKDRLEHNIKFEKGVKTVSLDLDSKVLTVTFDEKKNSLEGIRTAISNLGYSADDVAANAEAYNKLHGCCKSPDANVEGGAVPKKAGGCCAGGSKDGCKKPKE